MHGGCILVASSPAVSRWRTSSANPTDNQAYPHRLQTEKTANLTPASIYDPSTDRLSWRIWLREAMIVVALLCCLLTGSLVRQVGIIREDYSRYKFLKEQLQAVEQQQETRGGGGGWAPRPSISP